MKHSKAQTTKRLTNHDPKTTVAFSMRVTTVDAVKRIADIEERPVSWVAEKLLLEALEARERKNG